MVWLIGFILAHSAPITLNAWACGEVYRLNVKDKSGCYDICHEMAMKAHPILPWTGGVSESEVIPVALSDEYSHELQNACAVVLNGGEY